MVVPEMTTCPVCAQVLGGPGGNPSATPTPPTGVTGTATIASWEPTSADGAAPPPTVPPVPGPAGAAGPPPRATGGSHRRGLRNFALAGTSFVLVLALALGAFLVLGGSDEAHALEVTLQPLDEQIDKPFTDSVVTLDPAEARRFVAGLRHVGTSEAPVPDGDAAPGANLSSGDTDGLYGIDPSAPVCDRAALEESLTADDQLARVWADTMGITPADISPVITGMTPALVVRDTAVTNHFYGSDGAEPFQGVLEAGTAVLIDARGAPRVQCICGNPLADPADTGSDPTYVGTRWEHFDDASVVSVEPAPRALASIEAIDVATGDTVTTTMEPEPELSAHADDEPDAATDEEADTVELDGYLVTRADGVDVVSDDGDTTTRLIDGPVATAFDDGAGGIIFQRPHTGDERFGDSEFSGQAEPPQSTITQRSPADSDEATIWHLAAGAAEAVPVVGPDEDADTFPAIDAVGSLGDRTILIYEALPDAPGDDAWDGVTIHVRDLDDDSTESTDVTAALTGTAESASVATLSNDTLLVARSFEDRLELVRFDSIPDGQADDEDAYSVVCESRERYGEDDTCTAPEAVIDETTAVDLRTNDEDVVEVVVVDPSTGKVGRTLDGTAGTACLDVCFYRATGSSAAGSKFLHYQLDYGSEGVSASTVRVWDLDDDSSETLSFDAPVRLLTAPIIRPADDDADGGSSSTTVPPVLPMSCGLVTSGNGDDVEVTIVAGTVDCDEAIATFERYYHDDDLERSGSGGSAEFDGWQCSSNSAAGTELDGHASTCERGEDQLSADIPGRYGEGD